jgi:hypothetical protein
MNCFEKLLKNKFTGNLKECLDENCKHLGNSQHGIYKCGHYYVKIGDICKIEYDNYIKIH